MCIPIKIKHFIWWNNRKATGKLLTVECIHHIHDMFHVIIYKSLVDLITGIQDKVMVLDIFYFRYSMGFKCIRGSSLFNGSGLTVYKREVTFCIKATNIYLRMQWMIPYAYLLLAFATLSSNGHIILWLLSKILHSVYYLCYYIPIIW